MSLVNDPRVDCGRKDFFFLEQLCVVYLITILCLRYVGFCTAGVYLRHLTKGTCAPSQPAAFSTLIWDPMRLLNTDLVPAVIHTFQPSFVLSTLLQFALCFCSLSLFFHKLSFLNFIIFFSQGLLAFLQTRNQILKSPVPLCQQAIAR